LTISSDESLFVWKWSLNFLKSIPEKFNSFNNNCEISEMDKTALNSPLLNIVNPVPELGPEKQWI